MRILLTGGTGLLGTELRSLNEDYIAPSRCELNVTSMMDWRCAMLDIKPDLIVHAAAYTDTVKAEKDKCTCQDVNEYGTINGVHAAQTTHTPFIYISTEYIYGDKDTPAGRYEWEWPEVNKPINWYSYTKTMADIFVRSYPGGLSLRTTFKPVRWEWETAFTNQYTAGDYVDVIAKEIDLLVRNYYKLFPEKCYIPAINIGTGRKSIYDLAIRRNPKVQANIRENCETVKIPYSTVVNHDLWDRLKGLI